jgi:uncharacterized protein YeaO (DUF488 family)
MMRRNGMNSNVKYFKELDKKSDSDAVDRILKLAKEQNSITLLYGSKEERFNNAVALKEYLEEKITMVNIY